MAADLPVALAAPVSLSVPRLLVQNGWRVSVGSTSRCTFQLYDTVDRRLTAGETELRLHARSGWIWWRGSAGHPRLEPRTWTALPAEERATVWRWARAHHRGAALAVRAEVRIGQRRHRAQRAGVRHEVEVEDERIDQRIGGVWQAQLRRLTVTGSDRTATEIKTLLAKHAVPAEEALLGLLSPGTVRAPRLHPSTEKLSRPCDVARQSMVLATLQWLYHDSEIAGGGDPDALRKLRVALRRLRSDLHTFRPLLEREWAEALRAELGALASELGAARDAEVCAHTVTELSAALEDGDRPAGLVLRARAQADAAARRAHLEAMLDGPGYLALVDRAVWAAARPRCVETSAVSVRDLATAPWRRLCREARDLEDHASAAQLHRMRILVKRARTAVEACSPVVGSAASVCAQLLARLQGILGDHHDASLVIAWLRDLAGQNTEMAYVAGQMVALERRRQEEAATAWRPAWAEASRPRHWRWLVG